MKSTSLFTSNPYTNFRCQQAEINDLTAVHKGDLIQFRNTIRNTQAFSEGKIEQTLGK